MKKVTSITKHQDIKQEACAWVSRIDRGLSPEEKAEFALWVSTSEQHKEAVYSMASLWDDLSVLNQLSDLFPIEKKKRPNTFISRIGFSMAAGVLLCALLIFVTYPSDSPVEMTQLLTPVGEQATHTLDDGSLVHLNTNTKLKVAFSHNQRRLILLQGEAQFDVAPDKSRPFSVSAGEQTFTALGTIFNVQKLSNRPLELVVTEGKVMVSDYLPKAEQIKQVLSSQALGNRQDTSDLVVSSGEKAVLAQDQQQAVVKVSEQQVEKDLAWMHGMLIFDGEPLEQALAEVGRYTDTQFEISDPQIASLKVAGYFKAGDIAGLLSSLESNFPLQHHRIASKVIRVEGRH